MGGSSLWKTKKRTIKEISKTRRECLRRIARIKIEWLISSSVLLKTEPSLITLLKERERRIERDMSGVGFLAAVKTFTPSGRRRRRCEKQQKVLELPAGYAIQPDVVPTWDAAPPITPPAAFLPPGYKKGFPGELLSELSGKWYENCASKVAKKNKDERTIINSWWLL